MFFYFVFFLVAFLIFYNTYLVITRPKRNMLKRLKTYTTEEKEDIRTHSPLKADERSVRLSLKEMGKFLSRVDRLKGVREHFDSLLMKSGILLRGEEFIVILIIASITIAALGLFLFQSILAAFVGLFLGIYAPVLYLMYKKKQRQKLFNEQLSEVLTTMSNALKSGHSLLKALEIVAKDSPDPAAKEISNTVKEMQLGISTEEALKNLNSRIESRDLELMITAILIQRQVGGNLAEVLDSIADTIRDRLRIEGEIKTLTAQGRLSGIIISLLPVGLGVFFYVVNPEYIMELFLDPRGILMLVVAAVGQFMGIIFIRKIVNIDV